MMLFIPNRTSLAAKNPFLSGTLAKPNFCRSSGENPIFLAPYPNPSPIIPVDPGCLE
jgi:hypothetical protein